MIINRLHILSGVSQPRIIINLKLVFAFAQDKKETSILFKALKSKKNSEVADLTTKKSGMFDSIKQKVKKKLTMKASITVPAPERYQQSTVGEDKKSESTNISKQQVAVRQKHPNCTSRQYKILIKDLNKEQIRKEILFIWQLYGRKDIFENLKYQKIYHDIAQSRYLELLKEQVRKAVAQHSKQTIEADFRSLRALFFIEHISGLHEAIKREIKDSSIPSIKIMFITGMGNKDGLSSNLSRLLQMWCFQKRYFGELEYENVIDQSKNYSGYSIDFKVRLQ